MFGTTIPGSPQTQQCLQEHPEGIPVGVVREASAGFVRRHAQLVQHEEGVQVAQPRGAHRAADPYPRPLHHLLALNNLYGGEVSLS